MLRFVPLLLTLAACSSPDPVELHGSTMGTTWTVTLGGPLDEAQVAQAESIIAAILAEADAVLSGWNAASEISVINRRAETSGIALSEALYTVLDAGTTVQEETGGAFDITVAPLVALWGFGAGPTMTGRPSDAQIAAARSLVGPHMIELRAEPRTVRKRVAGVRLDVDAIAPGYAVDRISEELLAAGYGNHIVEIGGEVRCQGRGPGAVLGGSQSSAHRPAPGPLRRWWRSMVSEFQPRATTGIFACSRAGGFHIRSIRGAVTR
jgi:thiamine biosynthesis lipoprotein